MSADQADFPVAAMARVLGVSKGFSTLECELLARRPPPRAGRGTDGGLQFHRGLLQSAAPSLGARRPLTRRRRAENGVRTDDRDPALPSPLTVHRNGAIPARNSLSPCSPAPSSCLGLSEPRSGAASAPSVARSSSSLAACPTPPVLAAPLNQPGPKPAGQVTSTCARLGRVRYRRRPRPASLRARGRALPIRA